MKLKLPRPGRPKSVTLAKAVRTAVSFTAEDLEDIARILAAGQALLRTSAPVVSRLKAAMTKLGVSTKGL
jgi:hypothetical protein